MGGWGARVDGEGEVWVDGELEWICPLHTVYLHELVWNIFKYMYLHCLECTLYLWFWQIKTLQPQIDELHAEKLSATTIWLCKERVDACYVCVCTCVKCMYRYVCVCKRYM